MSCSWKVAFVHVVFGTFNIMLSMASCFPLCLQIASPPCSLFFRFMIFWRCGGRGWESNKVRRQELAYKNNTKGA